MSQLPHRIIVEILSRVLVKPLLRFKSVCKLWDSLISDPQFAKLQLRQSMADNKNTCCRVLLMTWPPKSVDFEESTDNVNAVRNLSHPMIIEHSLSCFYGIIGSCNGLVCLYDEFNNILLGSPTTRDYRELPKPTGSLNHMFGHGLGYNSSIDDYQIVFASKIKADGFRETGFNIFTLRTSTWRRIQGLNSVAVSFEGPGTFWNGRLHWLRIIQNGTQRVFNIVSFDLQEEKFKDVLTLTEYYGSDIFLLELGTSGKWLYLFCEKRYSHFEAFVMEVNGNRAAWSRLFKFPHDRFPGYGSMALHLTKSGQVVVNFNGWQLGLYNPKQVTVEYFDLGNCLNEFEAHVYGESLISSNNY
ncbi:hypothetical protein K2173_019135 [Erythroxylum novogranatense]|uniref:F-box domain-containing protein n=1 Tax=Erythroxylum novogranatense TaxID=1862640 RepID=A0AAV8SSR3_9ROSI|nr:hypothetical protein K2173_019135 [Erythroxylum novogranatense]